MSTQVAIYICAFMGMTTLMALFGCLIYRRHRQMVDQLRAYERMAQERIQQAQESNLPPFYIDHVRDRACVFEGELPPDNYPRALEVVVVRPRREGSMEDLIPAGTTAGSTTTGTDGQPSDDAGHPHSHLRRNPSSTMGLPDMIVSEMPHLGIPVVEAGVIRPSPAGSFPRRPMRAVTTNNSNPSPFAAAVLLPPIPTLAVTAHDDNSDNTNSEIDGQERIHTLPPPPSYDITHTHATPEQDMMVRPVSAPPATDDYFSYHNISHTHSLQNNNNNNHSHTQQQPCLQTSPQTSTPSLVVIDQAAAVTVPSSSSSPIETPRYSDEFPSHIPHEQHLEGYRRARALSDVSLQHPQQELSSLSAVADPTITAPASAAEASSWS